MDGSDGQHKLGFTIFSKRTVLEVDNTLNVPVDVFRHSQQIIFRKRTEDLLSNPKADSLLSHVPVHEFIIFGNGLEDSVKAVSLRAAGAGETGHHRRRRLWLLAQGDGGSVLRQMAAKGAGLITIDELQKRKLDRRMRRRWRPVVPHNGNGHGKEHDNGQAGAPRASNGGGETPSTGNGQGRSSSACDHGGGFLRQSLKSGPRSPVP